MRSVRVCNGCGVRTSGASTVKEDSVRWTPREKDGCAIVHPDGVLDPSTYRGFSDDLVKFTIDEPRAVVVVLDRLRITSEELLTAFTSAWHRVDEWPAVPILLVAHQSPTRELLMRSAIRRFIPVHDSVAAAVTAVADPPLRRRANLSLAQSVDCGRRARRFIEEVTTRWQIVEACIDAQVVGTELVENAVRHSGVEDDIELRLELRNGLLTVAVADCGPGMAVLREPDVAAGKPAFHSLHVISRMARTWGSAPCWPVGKVVWATLTTAQYQWD